MLRPIRPVLRAARLLSLVSYVTRTGIVFSVWFAAVAVAVAVAVTEVNSMRALLKRTMRGDAATCELHG